MDADRFDTLSRHLGTVDTRRGLLRLIGALPLAGALAALRGAEGAAADDAPADNLQDRADRRQKRRDQNRRRKSNRGGDGQDDKDDGVPTSTLLGVTKCKTVRDCTDPLAPTCEESTGACQPCTSTRPCWPVQGVYCCPDGTCADYEGCVDKNHTVCTTSADCSDSWPICEQTTATCKRCRSSQQCVDAAKGNTCRTDGRCEWKELPADAP